MLDPLHFSGGSYAVYDGDDLLWDGVTFNHATGLLYRNQPFGVAPDHTTFDVQAGLRDRGRYQVGSLTAISWRLSNGPYFHLWQAEVAIGCVRIGTFD